LSSQSDSTKTTTSQPKASTIREPQEGEGLVGLSESMLRQASHDPVDRPAHYTRGRIEVLDFILDQGLPYLAGHVVRYVCRYRFKGKPLEDLKKARFYLERLIEQEERGV
jgi:hypothetical protein